MRVLIVEDDQGMAENIALILKKISSAIDIANDGERGRLMALTTNYDLILLDYNLPKINGREILEELRKDGKTTPVIMLTVRSELEDKVDLLNSGADDYLTKPFAASELLARIKSIRRRPENLKKPTLKVADVELNPDKFSVAKNGEKIFLSTKEFSLLEYLMENKGYFLSRQEIMEHVWDENADPFSNTVEVHIMKLRKKIEKPGEQLIFTLSNRGYKIDEAR